MANIFDVKIIFTQIPDILEALPITLELAILSMFFGLLLAVVLAIVKIKRIPVLRQLVSVYISVIRGTPIIVQLYISYFGIPISLKYINYAYGTNFNVNNVPNIVFAIVAMALNEAAYNAEVIRGALESIDKGQIEAANSLGMTYWQAFRRIIFPEALLIALPALGNSFIGLIKGTSLAFTCAIVEMTAKGKILANHNYRYFEMYISLAIIYWIVTFVIERLLILAEHKLKVPDEVPENIYVKTEV